MTERTINETDETRDPRLIGRRIFLRNAAIAGISAPILLNACGGDDDSPDAATASATEPSATSETSASASSGPSVSAGSEPSASSASSAVSSAGSDWIPTYQAPQVPTPDFPPTDAGVQAGYISYPSQLTKTVPTPPGNGSTISVTVQLRDVPPTPLDSNSAWQAVNAALNAEIKPNYIPSSDYTEKSATVIASGDITDLMFLERDNTIADLPAVMEALFTDLTPYIGGDKVLEYPNLAAVPTSAWVWPSVNQKIYAVPIVRPPFNWMPFINKTRWDEVGATAPTSAAELKEVLQMLTNPSKEQYGIGMPAPTFGLVTGDGMNLLALFNVPHNWTHDADGKFTKDFETEEFREALAFVRDLYQSGVYYPGSNVTLGDLRNLLIEGKVGLTYNGWAAYGSLLWFPGLDADPPQEIRLMPLFSASGGDIQFYAYHGVNGMQLIKKTDDEKVKEILRVMNYMAAPFGSEEYQLLNFGVEGQDFNFGADGLPELTESGELNVGVDWQDIANTVAVLGPADEAYVSDAYNFTLNASQYQISDGALGLYSKTQRDMGGRLAERFHQGIGEIVRGQRDESVLDGLLDDWRSAGGDDMRKEYEQSYADSQ